MNYKIIHRNPPNLQTIKTMSQSATTQMTYPVLCIPRAMLFHTAEFVENAFNHAMGGKFVKSVGQSTTTDKSGTEFNVFFIHPDQDFKANRNTDTLYKNLSEQGIVNISTGSGKYFWKVKLYVPHMKAQYLPPKPVEVPVPVGPRIMTEKDLAEFRLWQAEKAAAFAEKERNAFGERLYPLVSTLLTEKYADFLSVDYGINHAGKITGMLLDLDVTLEFKTELLTVPATLDSTVSQAIDAVRENFKRHQ
jgi:hypothetical protein